ncbi:hypothetical protein [uncultured Microscilla sp.]|uniref:hypothetical protein n=1 Tax=uncultured Microscilla sp. TaxID=432653 RepID=UPI00260BA87D|nr:hypothetical protein [uncultured Microscilla sp.]
MKQYGGIRVSKVIIIYFISLVLVNLVAINRTLIIILTYNLSLSGMFWLIALQFCNQVKLFNEKMIISNAFRVWKPIHTINYDNITKLIVKTESTYGNLNLLIYTNNSLKSSFLSKSSIVYRFTLPKPTPFVKELAKLHLDLVWKHNGKVVKKKTHTR